ncbi:MAG: hypothetical protein ACP5LN_10105 [Thermoproteota archaeon]
MVKSNENSTLFYFQLAKIAFDAGLYGACTIYCACALETFLTNFAISHPLEIEKIKGGEVRLSRNELLNIAEHYKIIDSTTRRKCKQIFSIRDGHAHYHLGLWKKTFNKLKSTGVTEVHSMELAQLVLEDTYEIFMEILSQLRKAARTGDSSAKFLLEKLEFTLI